MELKTGKKTKRKMILECVVCSGRLSISKGFRIPKCPRCNNTTFTEVETPNPAMEAS